MILKVFVRVLHKKIALVLFFALAMGLFFFSSMSTSASEEVTDSGSSSEPFSSEIGIRTLSPNGEEGGYAYHASHGGGHTSSSGSGTITVSLWASPANPVTNQNVTVYYSISHSSFADQNASSIISKCSLGGYMGWGSYSYGSNGTLSGSYTRLFGSPNTYGYSISCANSVFWSTGSAKNGDYQSGTNNYSGSGSLNVIVSPRTYQVSITNNGTGVGAITGTNWSCSPGPGGTCVGSYVEGTNVTFTATEADGNVFNGWTGCDSNPTANQCTITANANKSMGVTFDLEPLPGFDISGPLTHVHGMPYEVTWQFTDGGVAHTYPHSGYNADVISAYDLSTGGPSVDYTWVSGPANGSPTTNGISTESAKPEYAGSGFGAHLPPGQHEIRTSRDVHPHPDGITWQQLGNALTIDVVLPNVTLTAPEPAVLWEGISVGWTFTTGEAIPQIAGEPFSGDSVRIYNTSGVMLDWGYLTSVGLPTDAGTTYISGATGNPLGSALPLGDYELRAYRDTDPSPSGTNWEQMGSSVPFTIGLPEVSITPTPTNQLYNSPDGFDVAWEFISGRAYPFSDTNPSRGTSLLIIPLGAPAGYAGLWEDYSWLSAPVPPNQFSSGDPTSGTVVQSHYNQAQQFGRYTYKLGGYSTAPTRPLPLGDYELRMFMDVNPLSGASNIDYRLIGTETISVTDQNLETTALIPNGNLYVGETITFSATVVNRGTVGQPTGGFENEFEVDTGGGPTVFSTVPVSNPGIAIGGSQVVESGSVTFTASDLGQYDVTFCADSADEIPEAGAGEADNCITETFTVTYPPPPEVTLSVCESNGTNCTVSTGGGTNPPTSGGTKYIPPLGEIIIEWSSPEADQCEFDNFNEGAQATDVEGQDLTIDEPNAGLSTTYRIRCGNGAVGAYENDPSPPWVAVDVTNGPEPAGGGDASGAGIIPTREIYPRNSTAEFTCIQGSFTDGQCTCESPALGLGSTFIMGGSLLHSETITADSEVILSCDDGMGTTFNESLIIRVTSAVQEN